MKHTREEKKLFKGHGGTEGLIQKWEVIHKPDLTKMSSKALNKWKNKVQDLTSPSVSGESTVDVEWRRVSYYIRSILKEVIITDRDLVRAIKKRRNILHDDICIDGVSIICGQSKGNELSIEYY
ncbi:MAG: hypothetical protein J7L15_02595 [Clostridiales bacterium]|nr:hypothetical protein [Clostridiales bacterium]